METRTLLRAGGDMSDQAFDRRGIYFYYHDKFLLILWFILVCFQWQTFGSTIGIIPESTSHKVGIILDLLIGFIFTLDTIIFKSSNRLILSRYSTLYQFIDYLSGPIALAIDIPYLYIYGKLSVYSVILRSCKCLSLIYSRNVFANLMTILPLVKDMFACLFCVFFLFTYLATFFYADLFVKEHYFNTIGFSFLTMLQIMTLDGWGQIGRHVLSQQSLFSASFFILFVFTMAYFFWNILIGFILDIIRHQQYKDNSSSKGRRLQQPRPHPQRQLAPPSKDISVSLSDAAQIIELSEIPQDNHTSSRKELDQSSASSPLSLSQKNTFIESFSLGEINKHLVVGLYLSLILDSLLQTNLRNITNMLSITLHMITGLIFTLQLAFILGHTRKPNTAATVMDQEKKHILMMVLHALSGPIAFAIDVLTITLNGNINIGCIFKYMKVLTVTRDMFVGSIMIFPTLVPAFLGIISAIFALAIFALSYLSHVENFWTDFATSVYTFVQILTLDDWAAKIVKDMLKHESYLAPFLIVAFIFIANYFFLNIMVAISSEVFEKVSTKQYLQLQQDARNNIYQKTFYERLPPTNDDDSIGAINSLQQLKEELSLLPKNYIDIMKLHSITEETGEKKQLTEAENELVSRLLEKKHGRKQLPPNSQPIVFTFQGQSVQISSQDLQNIKLNLLKSSREDNNTAISFSQ